MKKILRDKKSEHYYDQLWKYISSEEDYFTNLHIYPIKYAEEALRWAKPSGLILECGCGLGRVLKHYYKNNRRIIGLEFNEFTLLQIRKENPGIPLVRADARNLPFKDTSFEVVFAYGLYHNIENNIDEAIRETARVIKPNGIICASSRMQNIMFHLYELKHRIKKGKPKFPVFFKWVVKKQEWIRLFSKQKFSVISIYPAFKIPLLYRFFFLRDRKHVQIGTSELRTCGFRLNKLGQFLDKCFHKLYAWSFCDRGVIIAKRIPPFK